MIGHVDADCFYVSAERVRYPHLCRMPIAVLGNHGACVIAKSYEMKAAGVPTGGAIWDAVPVCPNAVFVKRDFRWYEVLSRQMLALVQEISPRVEFYSIDESFFAAVDASHAAAERLQHAMLQRVGVPVSIGIAPSKTLAKLISDSSKPFGCGVVRDDADRVAILRDRPVTDITGIAKRSARRLSSHGITTCKQFADADRAFIRWLLTKRGEDLWWELNGTSVLPIQTKRPEHKFISRGGSIGRASNDPVRVQAFIVRNVERLVEALSYYKLVCDNLTLSLLFRDAPERSSRRSLLGSTADFERLAGAALEMMPEAWEPGNASVHYMHLIAGSLWPHAHRQLGLFDGDYQSQAIAKVKRQINAKLGRFALRTGSTLPLSDVYADPANEYDICDIHGKMCF
ncbi:MAG: DNA polymerase Y family protein [Aeoliella sp.]